MKRIIVVLLLAFVIISIASFASAECNKCSSGTCDKSQAQCSKCPEPKQSCTTCSKCPSGKCGETQPATCEDDKIKRVASNVGLGWTEVPKAIVQVTKDTDNPFLGVTVGLLKGVANAFARTASGLADGVTLPSQPGKDDQLVQAHMVPIVPGNTKSEK